MIKFFIIFLGLFLLPDLEGKSLTENSSYSEFCQLAAEDEEIFANFKRSPIYNGVMEHVSYELGLEYLGFIHREYPELISDFDKFRENDLIGNPITYEYGDNGCFSPTTLRYMKVAGDLKNLYGDLTNLHIVEIGGGYGGQCKILNDLGGFASYTIIDLPQCNALSQKYLTQHNVPNVIFINNDQLSQVGAYDLVISNFSFSEIDKTEQYRYIDTIIRGTPNGYMTMNFISHFFNVQSLSTEELIAIFLSNGHKGRIESEKPVSDPNNLLITWQKIQNSKVNLVTPSQLSSSSDFQVGNALTYSLSGGRFGDNLIAYLHAKWLSLKLGLPLIYKPFPYSDQLRMDVVEQHMSSELKFRNIISINKEFDVKTDPSSTLFDVPYFPECLFEYHMLHLYSLPFFKADWDDPIFKAEIRKCLSSKYPIKTLNLPNDGITVGVHVRRGGGVDPSSANMTWPLKFPPDSYYIQQLQRISEIFKNQKLYVYILTDDLSPKDIARKYKQALNNPNIKFACRTKNNNPHSNVLEDFFTIPKFDCFILCQSNFSLSATKLGDYMIKITPMSCRNNNGDIVVNEVETTFNGQ